MLRKQTLWLCEIVVGRPVQANDWLIRGGSLFWSRNSDIVCVWLPMGVGSRVCFLCFVFLTCGFGISGLKSKSVGAHVFAYVSLLLVEFRLHVADYPVLNVHVVERAWFFRAIHTCDVHS